MLFTILFTASCLVGVGQGLLKPKKDGDLYGYTNETGETVIDYIFEEAGPFHGDYAAVKISGLWRLIDKNGKVSQAVNGHDGLYSVSKSHPGLFFIHKENKVGIIRSSGKQIFPITYDGIYPWAGNRNIYLVQKEKKIGLVKDDGSIIIPIKYYWQSKEDFVFEDRMVFFDYGAQFALSDGNKWGVLDSDGKTIVPFEYDDVILFKDYDKPGKFKIAAVKKGNGYSLIGTDLKPLVPDPFEDVYGYYNQSRHLVLKKADGPAILNTESMTFESEIPFSVKGPRSVSNVRRKGLLGVVSYQGELVIPFIAQDIRQLNLDTKVVDELYFSVQIDGKTGVYNRVRGYVVPTEFAAVSIFNAFRTKYFSARKEPRGLQALLSPDGKILTDYQFNILRLSRNGGIEGKAGRKWADISEDGTITWR